MIAQANNLESECRAVAATLRSAASLGKRAGQPDATLRAVERLAQSYEGLASLAPRLEKLDSESGLRRYLAAGARTH